MENVSTSQESTKDIVAEVTVAGMIGAFTGGLVSAYSADKLNSAFTSYSQGGSVEHVFNFSASKWAEIGCGVGLVSGLALAGAGIILETINNKQNLASATLEN